MPAWKTRLPLKFLSLVVFGVCWCGFVLFCLFFLMERMYRIVWMHLRFFPSMKSKCVFSGVSVSCNP